MGTRGSSEGIMPPGLQNASQFAIRKLTLLRTHTEGTVDDNDVLLHDGDGNATPLSPDGYLETCDEGDNGPSTPLHVDDPEMIAMVESDQELDELDNAVVVVL